MYLKELSRLFKNYLISPLILTNAEFDPKNLSHIRPGQKEFIRNDKIFRREIEI